ncbi:hypothetical protein TNCV_354801 [Trichonephila clavipes]|uniref:Uncharacterized protein n=1 Tax=Trichonephila clavipes TaxID=2585209 RepID=A0A8X7BD10_TRICX|nr:hypothetical protein TNCV_354801 [Trichonephila clavipes]
MKSMQNSQVPITSFALNKMMKKLKLQVLCRYVKEVDVPSTAVVVSTTVEHTVQSMSAVASHGECSPREVSRQTRSVRKCLEITANNFVTVSLQVET